MSDVLSTWRRVVASSRSDRAMSMMVLMVVALAAAWTSDALAEKFARDVVVREPLGQPWAAQLVHWPTPDDGRDWQLVGDDGQVVVSQQVSESAGESGSGVSLRREISSEADPPGAGAGQAKGGGQATGATGPAVVRAASQAHRSPGSVTPLDGPDIYTLVDIEANGVQRYRIEPADGQTTASDALGLSVRESAQGVVLDNGVLAVHLPGSAAAGDGQSAPPPITRLRGAGGDWRFTGGIEGGPNIVRWATQVTARGPVFVEAVVTYEAVDGRQYSCRVRLAARQDVVHLADDFNLGAGAKLKFKLASTPEPDTLTGVYIKGAGHLVMPSKQPIGAEQFGQLAHIVAWQSYYTSRQAPYVALFSEAEQSPVLGVFGIFPQCWARPGGDAVDSLWYQRGPPPIEVQRTRQGGIELWLMLDKGSRTWGMSAHTFAEFEAGGVDAVANARRSHGETPLQKVKDWVTDWESDATHPQLFFDEADIPTLRERLAKLPDMAKRYQQTPSVNMIEDLTCRYLLAPDAKLAQRIVHGDDPDAPLVMDMQTHGLLTELRLRVESLTRGHGVWPVGPNNLMWLQDHWLYRPISADVMLGSPHVSDADKRELRRLLAILAYAMTSPEMMPPHMLYQWGTPNMPTGYMAVVAMLGSLLPDHPHAADWRAHAAAELPRLVDWITQPDGTYCESYFYQERVNRSLPPAMAALARAGDDSLVRDPRIVAMYRKQAITLMPKDPRNGLRNDAPVGDATWYNHKPSLLSAATLLRPATPDIADQVMWAWQQQGRPIEDLVYGNPYYYAWLLGDPAQPAEPLRVESTLMAGAGAILRARFGQPTESFVHLRAADFAISHFESDQLALHWVAKGVPLCMDWGLYYNHDTRGPDMHNRPVPTEGGYGLASIKEAALFDAADYLHAQSHGQSPHHRRLLFVKAAQPDDPEFILLRDTLPTPGYWNLWTAADAIEMAVEPPSKAQRAAAADDALLDDLGDALTGGGDVAAAPGTLPASADSDNPERWLSEKDRTLTQNLAMLNLPCFTRNRATLSAFTVPVTQPEVRYRGHFGVDLQVHWLTPIDRVEMGAYQWGIHRTADPPQADKGEHQKLLRLHRDTPGDFVVAMVSSLREVESKATIKPWHGEGIELTRTDGWQLRAWIAPDTGPTRDSELQCDAVAWGTRDGRLRFFTAFNATDVKVGQVRIQSNTPRDVELGFDGMNLTLRIEGSAGQLKVQLPQELAHRLKVGEHADVATLSLEGITCQVSAGRSVLTFPMR